MGGSLEFWWSNMYLICFFYLGVFQFLVKDESCCWIWGLWLIGVKFLCSWNWMAVAVEWQALHSLESVWRKPVLWDLARRVCVGISKFLLRLNMMRRSRLQRIDGEDLLMTLPMTSRISLEGREWWTLSSKLPWRVALTMLSWVPMITSVLVFASKLLLWT